MLKDHLISFTILSRGTVLQKLIILGKAQARWSCANSSSVVGASRPVRLVPHAYHLYTAMSSIRKRR